MSQPKTICCAKCQVEMSIRQFVEHRTGNGAPCSRVPCPVCGGPVGDDARLSGGKAVCSAICAHNAAPKSYPREAVREIDDQLAAMRRAEALPLVYQRRSRAG
jgi:hypothetical protein